MKAIILFSLLVYTVSCSTQKEIIDNEANNSETIQLFKGIVHLSEEGCPFYISTEIDGKSMKFYPINLEESFKVEGLKIKFSYNLSRAMQPENCQVDKVVSVSNVTK